MFCDITYLLREVRDRDADNDNAHSSTVRYNTVGSIRIACSATPPYDVQNAGAPLKLLWRGKCYSSQSSQSITAHNNTGISSVK